MCLLVVMVLSSVGGAFGAEDTLSASGNSNNVAPEVTSWSPPNADPVSADNFSVTIRDNNTLKDIENIKLVLWLSTASEGDADAVENHYTFWHCQDNNDWWEVGPSAIDAHITEENCVAPSDNTAQSDNYTFNITLQCEARSGTWSANVYVYDDNDQSDNSLQTFTVNAYFSVSLDDSTLTFSGSPGEENTVPTEAETVVTVCANESYDIEVYGSENWTGAAFDQTFGIDNLQADADNNFAENAVTLSTSAENVWIAQDPGEDQTDNIYWELDFPIPLRDDVYTATITVKVVAA